MDPEVDNRSRDAQEKMIVSEPNEKMIQGKSWEPNPMRYFAVKTEHPYSQPAPQASQPKSKKKPSTVLCLLIALAVAIALAAIAAGVAGSLAVKRQNKLNSCMKAHDDLIASNSSASCIPASVDDKNSTNPSLASVKPASACKTLGNQYLGATGKIFSLHCGIDLKTYDMRNVKDLMNVFVYTFEDCINACNSYNNHVGLSVNTTCYGASYQYEMSREHGNCWFKGIENIPFVSNETVDSAIFQNS